MKILTLGVIAILGLAIGACTRQMPAPVEDAPIEANLTEPTVDTPATVVDSQKSIKQNKVATTFEDADLVRLQDDIAAAGLSVEQIEFVDGSIPFRATVLSSAVASDGPTLLILHDNEQSAFNVGVATIAKRGGRLIALENIDRRMIGKIDPNRIFGDTFPLFTQRITELFPAEAPIITLHTNRDGFGGPNGTISVKKWLKGRSIRSYDHGDDEDNLIWMAKTAPLSEAEWEQRLLGLSKKYGFNFVFEHVQGSSDGSLSNWAALAGRGYVNVEAEEGDIRAQQDMLNFVLDERAD